MWRGHWWYDIWPTYDLQVAHIHRRGSHIGPSERLGGHPDPRNPYDQIASDWVILAVVEAISGHLRSLGDDLVERALCHQVASNRAVFTVLEATLGHLSVLGGHLVVRNPLQKMATDLASLVFLETTLGHLSCLRGHREFCPLEASLFIPAVLEAILWHKSRPGDGLQVGYIMCPQGA